MSTEVFPTIALRAADVVDRALPGFEWLNHPHCKDPAVRVLRKLPDGGAVTVYVGNGGHRFERGYRDDAVWFEVFGMGGPRGYSGPFFQALGALLGCEFVTELGQRLDERGIDSNDWGDADHHWSEMAVRAMEKAPGSTGGDCISAKPKPFVEVKR